MIVPFRQVVPRDPPPPAPEKPGRRWWTAAELADLQVEGWPRTKQAMLRRFARLSVRHRLRRDGAHLYRVEDLPAPLREAALAASAAEDPAPEPEAAADTDMSGRRAAARLALLREVDRLAEALGSVVLARRSLVETVRTGRDPRLAGLAREALARRRWLSVRTLERWAGYRDEPAMLEVHGRATGVPDWLDAFLAIWARPSKPSIAFACELLRRERPDIDLPSLRTVQRTVARLGAVTRSRGRLGPRELKTVRPYIARDFRELEPADVFVADGHTHDQLVLHPVTGKPFRPEIIAVIDVATRRCVGWSTGIAESAWLVADALRHACGTAVPAVFYTDRGSGFCNIHMDDPVTGVLARLGIRHETSLPYNSQARGVVERFHASCWIRGARLHAGYVGRDMDPEARKRVDRAVKRDLWVRGTTDLVPSWRAFVAWCEEQVRAYNARPHGSLPRLVDPATGRRRHMTPDEAWRAAGERGFRPVVPDARELDALFRPHVERTVRRGCVQLFDGTYFSRDLEEWHGRRVLVAYDVHDPQTVWVSDGDGRRICTAELDGNLVPYMPKSRIEAAREARAQARLARLERRAQDVRAELGGGPEIVPMPVESDPERRREIIRSFEPEERPEETRTDRYLRWREIDRRMRRGDELSDDEVRWHAIWPETPEGRNMLLLVEEFGEELVVGEETGRCATASRR